MDRYEYVLSSRVKGTMDRGVTEEQKSLASGSSQSHEPDS